MEFMRASSGGVAHSGRLFGRKSGVTFAILLFLVGTSAGHTCGDAPRIVTQDSKLSVLADDTVFATCAGNVSVTALQTAISSLSATLTSSSLSLSSAIVSASQKTNNVNTALLLLENLTSTAIVRTDSRIESTSTATAQVESRLQQRVGQLNSTLLDQLTTLANSVAIQANTLTSATLSQAAISQVQQGLSSQLATRSQELSTAFTLISSLNATATSLSTRLVSIAASTTTQTTNTDSISNVTAGLLNALNVTLQRTLDCAKLGRIFDGTSCVQAQSDDPLCTNLEAYYTFEGNVFDISLHNRDGSFSSSSYAPGYIGLAAQFSGANLIQVPSFANFNFRNSFSTSLWFYRNAGIGNYMGLINNGYYSNGGFEIRMGREQSAGNNRLLTAGINTNTDSELGDFQAVYATELAWHHVVLTFNGLLSQARLFLDGVEVPYVVSGPLDSGIMNVVNNPLFIGQGGTGTSIQYFEGSIDEVRVYSRTLTLAEVLQLYRLKVPSSCLAPAPFTTLGTQANPAKSCSAILNAGAAIAGQSVYWLLAGDLIFQATCDMITHGGGWTLMIDVPTPATWSSLNWYRTLSKVVQQDILANSNGEWRATATDNSNSVLFIYDPAPFHLTGTGLPCSAGSHFWQSTKPSSVMCRTSIGSASPWISAASASISCCSAAPGPYGIGAHTCGTTSGWILLHSGSTYNVAGHPCPATGTGNGLGGGTLGRIWIR